MPVDNQRRDLGEIKEGDLLNDTLTRVLANLRHRSRLRSAGFGRVWSVEVWEVDGREFVIYFEPIGTSTAPETGWTIFLPGSMAAPPLLPSTSADQLRALKVYLFT